MSNPFDDVEAAFAEPELKPQPKAEPAANGAPSRSRKSKALLRSEREAADKAIQAEADALEDGVYFALPFAVYLKVRALGSGSLRSIAISPGTFWADSWLNPSPLELSEEQAKRKEAFLRLGSAYHCARLEPDEFEERYCRELDPEDYADQAEGACWTATDVGTALGELGLTKKKAGESASEQAQRLRSAGFEGLIWALEKEEWESFRAERIALSAADWDAIMLDMERLRSNPEVAALLTDGFPEVSMIWTDPHGLRCKVRLDYLKEDSWSDLKTFANMKGQRLDNAIADAIRYKRYHMQMAHQREALELIRAGELQIKGEASEAARDCFAAIQLRPEELKGWLIFQEKGGIPNILAKEFPFWEIPLATRLQEIGAGEEQIEEARAATRHHTRIFGRALGDIERAKREFHLYSQVYPPGAPWAPIDAVSELSELDFNDHWLEGKYE